LCDQVYFIEHAVYESQRPCKENQKLREQNLTLDVSSILFCISVRSLEIVRGLGFRGYFSTFSTSQEETPVS
jgi:hypothetical protein